MGSCMSKSVKVVAETKHIPEFYNNTYQKMENTSEISVKGAGKESDIDEAADHDVKSLDPDDDEDEDADQDTAETKKKEPLTPEQIEELEKNTIEKIHMKMDQVKSVERFDLPDDNGHFPVQSRNLSVLLLTSYFALQSAPLDRVILFKRTLSSVLIETRAADVMCEIYKCYAVHGWAKEEDGKKITDKMKWSPFLNSSTLLMNYSDASKEFAVYVVNYPGMLEAMVHILVERKEAHLSEKQGKHAGHATRRTVSLTHNVAMVDANVKPLRDLDFTSVIQPYLQSPTEMIKLNALATLASIVDEKESEIINTNQGTVKSLLNCLRKALKDKLRRHNGWSCKECTYTIRKLARNDANKKMLYNLGAVELLVRVGQTGDEEEKYESVQALWNLAFDEEIRKMMVSQEDVGAVELLQNIRNTCQLPAIKKACGGTLWVMREELAQSKNKTYQDLGHELVGDLPKAPSKKKTQRMREEEEKGHIMISYQWADQKTLIQVRDVLQSNGFKVWMDIDQMAGSTLQAMADAVENSTIFLMSMSQKYKDSPNCRAEAEYAFTKHKKIIPLVMERGYRADGWLGFILGAKLFYDLSGKYPFENKMADLVKEIRHVGAVAHENIKPVTVVPVLKCVTDRERVKPSFYRILAICRSPDKISKQPVDRVDAPLVAHATTRSSVVSKTTVSKVRQWTQTDVQNWINKNDLKSCGVSNLTGGEVALLMTMRQEAPEFFYKCLQTMLNVNDLLTMSKIVWALTDLAELV